MTIFYDVPFLRRASLWQRVLDAVFPRRQRERADAEYLKRLARAIDEEREGLR